MLDTELNKKTKRFTSYKDNNTDENISFEIEFNKGMIPDHDDIMKEFKLIRKIGLTNMHLYSLNGSIKKYTSIKEILKEYYDERLSMYDNRKEYMLNIMKNELDLMTWKCKFILMVVEKKLKVNNRKRADIEISLEEHGFPKMSDSTDKKSYNYLLSMPIYNLTYEKIEELKKMIDNKQTEYDTLNGKTSVNIWREELELLKELI